MRTSCPINKQSTSRLLRTNKRRDECPSDGIPRFVQRVITLLLTDKDRRSVVQRIVVSTAPGFGSRHAGQRGWSQPEPVEDGSRLEDPGKPGGAHCNYYRHQLISTNDAAEAGDYQFQVSYFLAKAADRRVSLVTERREYHCELQSFDLWSLVERKLEKKIELKYRVFWEK